MNPANDETTTTIDVVGHAPIRHPSQPAAGGAGRYDGRNYRRDRNKLAVIDAFLDLIGEGRMRPSVSEIAERSGVSHRSVFRYFADSDNLIRSAIDRQVHRVADLIDTSVDHSLTTLERIDLVVRRRLAVHAKVAAVERLVRMLAPEQPMLQAELTNNRLLSRMQLARMFSPELTEMSADGAAMTLAAMDVLCSFDSFDLLGGDQCLSVAATSDTVRHALIKLLS